MKTYLELVNERSAVKVEIDTLMDELSTFEILSTERIAITATVSMLRIRLAQLQQEIILRFPS